MTSPAVDRPWHGYAVKSHEERSRLDADSAAHPFILREDAIAVAARRWSTEPRIVTVKERAIQSGTPEPEATRMALAHSGTGQSASRWAEQPELLLQRGLAVAVAMLLATSLLMSVFPVAAPAGAAAILLWLGLVIHADFSLRGRSIMSVNFATVLIVAGAGSLVLFLARLVGLA